jgi:hypothetical protein
MHCFVRKLVFTGAGRYRRRMNHSGASRCVPTISPLSGILSYWFPVSVVSFRYVKSSICVDPATMEDEYFYSPPEICFTSGVAVRLHDDSTTAAALSIIPPPNAPPSTTPSYLLPGKPSRQFQPPTTASPPLVLRPRHLFHR